MSDNWVKRATARVLIFFAAVAALSLPADGRDEELLRTLLENGVITQEQYDRLSGPSPTAGETEGAAPAEGEKPEEQVAGEPPAEGEVVAENEKPTPPKKDWVQMRLGNRGLVVTSDDDQFTMTISGRLHVEVDAHTNDDDLPDGDEATDGIEIRRARFMMAGKFYEDWGWTGEVDFADNKVAVKDFWFGYNGFPHTALYLGHVKQPYSLSVEMSSNDIPFIERSIDNYLIAPFVDRALGLRGEFSGNHWFLATGIFGESVEPNKEDDEGWGSVGRFVYAPVRTENMGIHLAARAAYRQPATNKKTIEIKDETTHQSNLTIVDTGPIEGVHDVVLVGGEAAIAYGPLSAIAEYTKAYFNRRGADRPDVDFDSWRVAGTWILTGERRMDSYRMNAGEFKRLTPKNNFSLREGGGWGAWELATRLAGINLNDGPVVGGTEKVFTLGLNWYVDPIVRFMFEWSRIVDTDRSNDVRKAAEGINIFQFRGQLAF
jgi:phosphate-selective porin OprO/OprP